MKYLLGMNELNNEIKINVPNSNTFICGCSGTGKSTLIHKIIKNLQKELENENLKLCFIDTKNVEFYRYNHTEYVYLPNAKTKDEMKKVIQHLFNIIKQRHNENHYKIILIIEDLNEFYYLMGKRIFNLFLTILKQGKEYGIYSIVSTQNPCFPFCNEYLSEYFDNIVCFKLLSKELSVNLLGISGAESLEFQKEAMIKNINGINKIKLVD